MIWLKHYAADLVGAYTDGIRAIRALPWFFGIVIAIELVQHVMEVRAGFFKSYADSRIVQDDVSRMIFGYAKMVSIYVGAFLVLRVLAGRVNAPAATAALRFLPYAAYSLTLFLLMFHARKWLSPEAAAGLQSTLGMSQIFVEPLLMLWFVSAATDGAVRTPWSSACQLGWFYAYALPLFFIARLPLYGLHRALNFQAMGQPAERLWPILLLDAVMVALIIAVIPAIAVRITRRWAERPGAAPAGMALT